MSLSRGGWKSGAPDPTEGAVRTFKNSKKKKGNFLDSLKLQGDEPQKKPIIPESNGTTAKRGLLANPKPTRGVGRGFLLNSNQTDTFGSSKRSTAPQGRQMGRGFL